MSSAPEGLDDRFPSGFSHAGRFVIQWGADKWIHTDLSNVVDPEEYR